MYENVLALSNYVTVTQNNSKHFSPEDIVHICKRKNNAKRDFLFVNAFQGKHLCVSPNTAFTLYEELTDVIRSAIPSTEKVVVIGFAETATAIGHYIAYSLENCIYYMQTTREQIEGVSPVLEFSEEHSHATEQLLYGDFEILKKCDRILFIDDEISTGNTILNFISALEGIGVRSRYSVASFLNWQNEEWSKKFEILDISIYFVIRGSLKDLSAKVPIDTLAQSRFIPSSNVSPILCTVNCKISNFYAERLGNVHIRLEDFSHVLYSNIERMISSFLPHEKEEVLVLGTEEFMFAPLVFGQMLGYTKSIPVWFHATTRSPIETSNFANYAISKSFSITSCYDSSRNTFIYNLRKYDRVFIVTDVIPNENFIKDITAALVSVGTLPENIIIIVLKG